MLQGKKSSDRKYTAFRSPTFRKSLTPLPVTVPRLMNHALDKAAADNSVTKQYLNDVAAGPVKRQMIDDATIMVIDLEN